MNCWQWGSVVILLMLSFMAKANAFCFLKAETYYEQTYCEVSAKGYGKHLPDFYDFKKNDPLIQALLLKKPAARSGIALVMPTRKVKRAAPVSIQPDAPAVKPMEKKANTRVTWYQHCAFEGNTLNCPTRSFQLVGNKRNGSLAPGMLSADTTMGLRIFTDDVQDEDAVNAYLVASYTQYVRKMLDIGLGGVTMSAGKFAFLFEDLTARGLSFSERFETMYRYLKKDKSTIRVDERVSLDRTPNIEQCINLQNEIISCALAQKNLLFVRQG